MKKSILLASIITVALSSCTENKKYKEVDNLALEMTGAWENQEITVEFESYRGKNDSVISIDHTNWLEKKGYYPQVIYFKPDGEYESIEYHLNGIDSSRFSGSWQILNDELVIDYGDVRRIYEVRFLNDSIAELRSILDADNDQEKDDKFYGKIKKLN